MSAEPTRLSFAKVAASAGKNNVALGSFAKVAASNPGGDNRKENISAHDGKKSLDYSQESAGPSMIKSVEQSMPAVVKGDTIQDEAATALVQPPREAEAELVNAVKALSVNIPPPSLVVNGSGSMESRMKSDIGDGFSDDAFQRTDSGSELGTKPPSLDGKSITSGTTFALDEKESLRPDDSASVKAAEDDDAMSARGSIVAGSRIGSEAAARAYRAQFYEAPDRRTVQSVLDRQTLGAVTPQSGSSEQQITDEAKPKPLVGAAGTPEAFNLFYRQTPDEKLLEALDSPKDRIFLLRLEQDVIEFVKDSQEPFIDLPPCNSFCRMLIHKLADYYHMTHQVNEGAGGVRIFRTPFCRLPASLTSISNPPTSGNTPPPQVPTMKIMRRGGGGDTGPSPSKATSETGSDGKDKALSAKEKLSREEREAAYNKARERIFGKDEKSGDATPDTEDGNEMSRSSSVSTKDRSGQNKKAKPMKQRRDDDDLFDKRSDYGTWFPSQQTQVWTPGAQFPPIASQQHFNGGLQGNYQSPMPAQYGSPNPQFSAGMMSNPSMQYNPMPQAMQQQFVSQSQQLNTQQFQRNHSAPITAYGSPVQSPPASTQQWQQQQQQQQNMFQAQYPAQGQRQMMGGPQGTVPYAFGQLPTSANPADPKSQHPIPGSYTRHGFNPKTQSFVPGNSGLPVPPTMSHHGSPHHGSPHHGSPHLQYNAYTPPQQQYGNGMSGNGMGYSMARQGSNPPATPSYHASPHMPHRPMMHQGQIPQMPQISHMPQIPQMPQHHHVMQGMQQHGQVGHHLPNYGNPSTLPPKPPTGV